MSCLLKPITGLIHRLSCHLFPTRVRQAHDARPIDVEKLVDDEVTVTLPDIFQSFLKEAPTLNPHYESVRLDSEQWIDSFCSLSPEMQKKVHKLDFAYFCAIAAPSASRKSFKTLCDWGNWVFIYDDMFDEGELRYKYKTATVVSESLLEPFTHQGAVTPGRLRVVEAHDDVATRVFSTCSEGTKKRYLRSMEKYNAGVAAHIDDHISNKNPSVERMIEMRRVSIGAAPLYHLIEYACNLEIPDEVFSHPIIQELEVLGMDIVFISNDILSYRKEEIDGVTDNLVAVYRMNGLSAQSAFNVVGNLLDDRFRRWDTAEASVPSWGPKVDEQVSRYIDGIKAVVQANAEWSFRTPRYFGKSSDSVRHDRRITVLNRPSCLLS